MIDCTNQDASTYLNNTFGFDTALLRNKGCGGGRMDWTWEWIKNYGAMWYDDYPAYSSGTDG